VLGAEDRTEEMLNEAPASGADATERRLQISGRLDRHAAEALRLEIERFARGVGITLTVTVERAEERPASA
jgi:hypothetical protein